MIEKVAAFVLRPSRQGVEILTLEHPRGGLQVPGGTVNAGEAPETAVLRELHEETGLTEVRIIRKLGEERVDLPARRGVLLQKGCLHVSPSESAPLVDHDPAPNSGFGVEILDRQGDWLHVQYREVDHCVQPPQLVWEVQGWIHSNHVDTAIRQEFYWLQTRSSTPDSWVWQTLDDLGYTFHLRWQPIQPLPNFIPTILGWMKWLKGITLMDLFET